MLVQNNRNRNVRKQQKANNYRNEKSYFLLNHVKSCRYVKSCTPFKENTGILEMIEMEKKNVSCENVEDRKKKRMRRREAQ